MVAASSQSSPRRSRARITTLADALEGEIVSVREIVFERTRIMCRDLGIHPGDVLRCAGRDVHALTVQSPSAGPVVLDPFYACFIAVERLPLS